MGVGGEGAGGVEDGRAAEAQKDSGGEGARGGEAVARAGEMLSGRAR